MLATFTIAIFILVKTFSQNVSQNSGSQLVWNVSAATFFSASDFEQ